MATAEPTKNSADSNEQDYFFEYNKRIRKLNQLHTQKQMLKTLEQKVHLKRSGVQKLSLTPPPPQSKAYPASAATVQESSSSYSYGGVSAGAGAQNAPKKGLSLHHAKPGLRQMLITEESVDMDLPDAAAAMTASNAKPPTVIVYDETTQNSKLINLSNRYLIVPDSHRRGQINANTNGSGGGGSNTSRVRQQAPGYVTQSKNFWNYEQDQNARRRAKGDGVPNENDEEVRRIAEDLRRFREMRARLDNIVQHHRPFNYELKGTIHLPWKNRKQDEEALQLEKEIRLTVQKAAEVRREIAHLRANTLVDRTQDTIAAPKLAQDDKSTQNKSQVQQNGQKVRQLTKSTSVPQFSGAQQQQQQQQKQKQQVSALKSSKVIQQ